MRSENRVDYPLQRDIVHEPGTTFEYNSAAVFLLGIAIEKAVGMPLPEYADEVLFGPLGILERRWEELREGYVNGGAGIDLRPRDLAKAASAIAAEMAKALSRPAASRGSSFSCSSRLYTDSRTRCTRDPRSSGEASSGAGGEGPGSSSSTFEQKYWNGHLL